MAKHKYIRKYLSKNGKWVYVYDDSTKSKTANKSNGSVRLDDFINARANARKSVNRAQTKIISKAVHMVDGKARYTYSKAKQSVAKYKAHQGYNRFIQKAVDTTISKANSMLGTFGYRGKSKYAMTTSSNPYSHVFNMVQNANVGQQGAGVHITAHPKPKNTHHQPTRRKHGSEKTAGSVTQYVIRAGKKISTPKKHKRKTTQVFGNSHGGHSSQHWWLI